MNDKNLNQSDNKKPDKLKNNITSKLQKEIHELTDALQRERADITNIRRRHDDQIKSVSKHVKAGVVKDLLPALDSLERALNHVPEDLKDHQYVQGVQGVVKQFEKIIKEMGVTKIKTVNQAFDPNLHEAISMEDGTGDREIVKEELQSGYMLDSEVIRPAMVKVVRQ